MNRRHVASRFVLAAAFGFFLAAYASGQDRAPAVATTERPVPGSVVKSIALDASVEERILALDPEHITGKSEFATPAMAACRAALTSRATGKPA
ncbi:MAG: hypothetical protein E6H64_03980 [Betaproteobacteria bacterium]|nr:MAG: hypothetical protein E6H64_03980 [Betaproteobacteria bacterium]